MNEKKDCIIMDIDGCLADNTEVFETCCKEDGSFDYKKHIELLPNMKVNDWCVELNQIYYHKHTSIIVTARKESRRELTEKWLKDNCICYDRLVMHPGRDMKDEDYKVSAVNKLAEQYNILLCVEDSPKNVDALRSNGYLVLQPNHLYEVNKE